jgi:two-component sensor histidine kinase
MTISSTDAAAEPERYLGGILDELTAAPTRDEAMEVVTRAARELAGCDGWYLLPHVRAGESPDHGNTLVVPLHEGSGHAAVGFFWQPWRTADEQSTRNLELLAKILGLAGRLWHAAEQHAIELHDERRGAAELQHRLRNNLALMRSVIRRSNETAESPEEFALHLDARIGALARTQGMLGLAGASGVELEELVRNELIASAVGEKNYRIEGPPVPLHGKAAESLGLALHELATNSLKFGALAAENGFLAVTWTVSGLPAPELHLSWIESGVTVVSLAPRRRGFGQELIECTLPYELEARTRLAFTPGGATCTIDIPLQACAMELEIPAPQAAGAGSP